MHQLTVRWTQRNGYFSVYTSLNELAVIGDGSLASGKPGFGARALPSGSGISEGRLGNLEYVAPGTISSTSLRTALFDTRVDLAWTGVVDDANGSGLLLYQGKRPLLLSITHNLPSREGPGMEIVQFSEAAPNHDVARRRVVFPCKISAELRHFS